MEFKIKEKSKRKYGKVKLKENTVKLYFLFFSIFTLPFFIILFLILRP